MECIAARALLEPRPKFFLLTSAATAVELAEDYDQWGDPDNEDTSMEVRLRCLGYCWSCRVLLTLMISKLGPSRLVASGSKEGFGPFV